MDIIEYIKNIENSLKERIEADIQIIGKKQDEPNSTLKHNHPPQIGLIPNCKYCEIYGNILEFGEVCLNETELKDNIYAFSNS